jgi:hypothetical protein
LFGGSRGSWTLLVSNLARITRSPLLPPLNCLVECEGIEPLVATLLNLTIGLQPTTGNTLH